MDKIVACNSKIMARTAGDGMESTENLIESSSRPNISQFRSESKDSLLPARLVQIFASNVIPEKKKSFIRSKSPKFVPYEPYTGAVKPIVPSAVKKGSKRSKNNMDINTLISQISQMDTKMSEFKPRPKLTSTSSEKNMKEVNQNYFPEKEEMQNKLDELARENETLKEQLKQQAQVNKELKTMLVASMGEDLETQVQSLNDDKKYLSTALLNSAQHLSTHQEQTEWLAGQCEVWRSKFLASSLMIEELANCKKILSDKTETLQLAIKQLFDERCRAREMLLCTYKNLYSLHERWLEEISIVDYTSNNSVYNRPIGNLNFNASIPKTANILDLSLVIMKLAENISSSVKKQEISHLNELETATDAEKFAENAIAIPVDIRRNNDGPVNALVHHAYSNSGTTPKLVASCMHCNGKVQLL